jgi:hypothetical protein
LLDKKTMVTLPAMLWPAAVLGGATGTACAVDRQRAAKYQSADCASRLAVSPGSTFVEWEVRRGGARVTI